MKYKVTLNAKVYEVEVEEGSAMLVDEYEAYVPAPAAAPVTAAPVAATPAVVPAASTAAPSAAGEVVPSPLPYPIDNLLQHPVLHIPGLLQLGCVHLERELSHSLTPQDGNLFQLLQNTQLSRFPMLEKLRKQHSHFPSGSAYRQPDCRSCFALSIPIVEMDQPLLHITPSFKIR